MAQRGVVSQLITMCKEGRDPIPAHALARIFIRTDPGLVSEALVIGAVSPLKSLAKEDYVLQQYDALLALTNIASLEETAHAVILKDEVTTSHVKLCNTMYCCASCKVALHVFTISWSSL